MMFHLLCIFVLAKINQMLYYTITSTIYLELSYLCEKVTLSKMATIGPELPYFGRPYFQITAMITLCCIYIFIYLYIYIFIYLYIYIFIYLYIYIFIYLYIYIFIYFYHYIICNVHFKAEAQWLGGRMPNSRSRESITNPLHNNGAVDGDTLWRCYATAKQRNPCIVCRPLLGNKLRFF